MLRFGARVRSGRLFMLLSLPVASGQNRAFARCGMGELPAPAVDDKADEGAADEA